MAKAITGTKSISLPVFGYTRQAGQARVLWIDNSRVIACFFMVLLHTSAGVVAGVADTASVNWWIGNLVNSFSRWTLPVFVMISGALLLDKAKEGPVTLFYKKRASRILTPLLFWTVFYLLYSYFGRLAAYGEVTSVKDVFNSIICGLPYYHLWYLYMIIGLYFFAPFLVKIIQHSAEKELTLLCISLFVFAVAGNLFVSWFDKNIPAVFTFIYYLPYFLAGYLISRAKFELPLYSLIAVFCVSFLGNAYGYYTRFGPETAAYSYFCSPVSITIVPMSLSVMFLLKKLDFTFIHPSLVAKAAALSLGIYVLHPFFLDTFRFAGLVPEGFSPLLSIPSIALLVFCLSIGSSFVMSKIPGLARTIGL